jgi:ABC-type proline/glycine betaine transport system ATPase subunit
MIKVNSNLFSVLSILICVQFTPGVCAQMLTESGSSKTTTLRLVQAEVPEPMRGREAPENGALLIPERRDSDEM